MAKFNWAAGLRATATLAAISGNSPDAKRRWSAGALEEMLPAFGPASTRVAEVVRANPLRPIAHDEAALVLQSLFVLHGADGHGIHPTPGWISFLLLALNDHLGAWMHDEGLTHREHALAATARAIRFDRNDDLAREVARAEGLFREAPCSGPLATMAAWRTFLDGALGTTVTEFVDRRLLPLALLSSMWGHEPAPAWYFPSISAEMWARIDGTPAAFSSLANDSSWTREELKTELQRQGRPLPTGTGHFFRKPLVTMPEGDLVAVSPGAVRWTLRAAAWSRCLQHTKSTLKKSADTWFSAFGYLVETWCRAAAQGAKAEGLRDQLILSQSPGSHDEIADIVLVEGNRVALISVKSRMMREPVIRSGDSSKDIVDWYEQFFFDQASERHRAESFWQLQRTMERVRAGEFLEQGIPRKAAIYPVLVSYDDIGDHPGLYPWLRDRCQHHSVFQDHRVAAPVVCSIADFELLLAAGVKKRSVLNLLKQKARRELRDVTLRAALTHIMGGTLPRLRCLEVQYDGIFGRAHARLRLAGAP